MVIMADSSIRVSERINRAAYQYRQNGRSS